MNALRRLRGRPPLLLFPWAVLLLPADSPKWLTMWSLAVAIFVGCKWLTWRTTSAPDASVARHVGYLLLWPGLDAAAFFDASRKPSPPSPGEWLAAFTKTLFGVGTLFAVRLTPPNAPYLAGWVGMVGIVFALHFGTFHVLSCAWRSQGVEAKPLMNAPLLAASLAEFWGRRWNTAFRDLTHRFLFRPLAPLLGAPGAVFAGFAFSGVVHDLVISLPAGGGYGGPTAFFLLSGLGLLLERSALGKRLGLGAGVRGRLFTMLTLLAPMGLLFHRPFVVDVVLPFLDALGFAP